MYCDVCCKFDKACKFEHNFVSYVNLEYKTICKQIKLAGRFLTVRILSSSSLDIWHHLKNSLCADDSDDYGSQSHFLRFFSPFDLYKKHRCNT